MNHSKQLREDLDYMHYHRTCQRCGKNWWGLHCPHDGYQNPCPECKAMPVVLNQHYCDCEFVVTVHDAEALITKEIVKELKAVPYTITRIESGDEYLPSVTKAWVDKRVAELEGKE